MIIKAIAIDDEINALGILREFCQRIPEVKLIKTFTDPIKALQFCNENTDFNLIFLDIQMKELDGLTLASALSCKDKKIIISTAYQDYAIQGFELNVADYLLKPYSFQRFEIAIEKIKSYFSIYLSTIETNRTLLPTSVIDGSIFIKSENKTLRVNVSDIQFIEGLRNYVKIHTCKKIIISLQNLKFLESQLKPYHFIRIHKSYIISTKYIDSIEKDFLRIGQHEIPIGNSFRDTFFEYIRKIFKFY